MGGTRATFRKLSRVSSNQRVKEAYCSFPGAGGMPSTAGRILSMQSHPLGKGLLHAGHNCCPQLLQ